MQHEIFNMEHNKLAENEKLSQITFNDCDFLVALANEKLFISAIRWRYPNLFLLSGCSALTSCIIFLQIEIARWLAGVITLTLTIL